MIFGLGASLNGACSISTATRLSSGDLNMVFTIVGWLLGWLLLESVGIKLSYTEHDAGNVWLSWAAITCLVVSSIYVYWRYRFQWRLWSGIMLVGILAGAIFLLQPAWSPSDFVRDLGLAIVHKNSDILPTVDRIAILMFMLLGMAFGAWRYRRFQWVIPTVRAMGKHLISGILMGIGATLALGGNDFQLLLALPAASPAGISATLGMLLGIWVGMHLLKRYPRVSWLP